MIKLEKTIVLLMLLMLSQFASAQRFNAGFVFQYHVLKQVDVKAPTVTGTYSHDIFKTKKESWKFFGSGQSIVVGMMAQLDYKKFYLSMELNYNLITYRYPLYYDVAPSTQDEVIFKSLFYYTEIPLYLGYQFQSTKLVRYSLFGGMIVSIPLYSQHDFDDGKVNVDGAFYDRYSVNDMRYILYNDDPFLNVIGGLGIHIASLARVDIRYIQRLGSPGDIYPVKFNTVGLAFTYFLPLQLKKRKFFYE